MQFVFTVLNNIAYNIKLLQLHNTIYKLYKL